MQTPNKSPLYVLYRSGVLTTDTLASVPKDAGINMSMFEYAHVQIIPTEDADPDVEVCWWSEAAGQFVKENPALAKTSLGVNTPYEFTVPCRGRIMFVAVTSMAEGGLVDVCVAGSVLHEAG